MNHSPTYVAHLNVGAVLCISLRERSDRREVLLREFSKSGLEIEFVLVDKDREDPQRGCFKSHLLCAQIMLDRGYNYVLVLEDDATLERYDPTVIARINRFLEKAKPDLLHLGVMLGKMWLTWHTGISRCRASGAHAYIISSSAGARLLKTPYTGLGVDSYFRRNFKQYCVFPMISFQQPESIGKSDIQEVRKDYGQVQTWEDNRRKQYVKVALGMFRTLFFRDL